MVGETTVGKTAICHQLSSDGTDFPKNYLTTTLSDVLVKSVKIPDTNDLVELFLMDSSGNEIYDDILKELLFITQRTHFENHTVSSFYFRSMN